MWLFLSLLTAFSSAAQSVAVKKLFPNSGAVRSTSLLLAYTSPFYAGLLFSVDWPSLPWEFWAVFIPLIPLNTAGLLSQMAAIRLSPVSISMPFLGFTPLFALFTGYYILGEAASPLASVGVLTLVAGAYVINLDPSGFLSPFAAIFRERGCAYMLLAAFIYSFCAVLGKKLFCYAPVVFVSCLFFLSLSLCFLLYELLLSYDFKRDYLLYRRGGTLLGFIAMVHVLLHGFAINSTKAAYMIAIKRSSGLFSVILGGLVLGESGLKIRFAGALLMFIGALFLACNP